jgi:fluoroquinolone transport system permease protein
MVKEISRDYMMLMLIVTPFLVGVLFKFGVPLLETRVLATFGYGDVIKSYYGLFSWLLALLTGMMFAFVGALVVLGEIDDGIARYILITPPGEKGYLFSRIVIPALISGAMSAFLVVLFALTRLSLSEILVMVVSTTLCGIIIAFFVVAISSNKVEGMAVGKISGLFGITFFMPLLIKGAVKYLFYVFPMYHVGVWSLGGSLYSLAAAAVLFIIWTFALYKLFRMKFN